MIIRTVTITEPAVRSLRFQGSRGKYRCLGEESTIGSSPADRTILILAPSAVSQRIVRLPIPDRRSQREVLPTELRPTLAADPSGLIFDIIPLSPGESLALWVERERMISLVESLPEGVYASVATISPTGWHMLVPERLRERTIILSDGLSAAVFHGGKPILYRPLSDELPRELALTAEAHRLAGNEPVEAILLFGKGADLYRSDPRPFPPESSLLPVDELTSFCRFDDPETALSCAGEASVVVAGGHEDDVNFLRGIISTRESSRIRRLSIAAVILSVTLVIILFGRLELKRRTLNREIASLDRTITAIYHEVFPRRQPVDPAAEIAAEIRRLSENTLSPLVLPTLRTLAEETRGGIRFTSVEIDGTTLTAKGEAPSLPAAEELARKLSGRIGDPSLTESSRKGDGTILFTLKGNVERGKR